MRGFARNETKLEDKRIVKGIRNRGIGEGAELSQLNYAAEKTAIIIALTVDGSVFAVLQRLSFSFR